MMNKYSVIRNSPIEFVITGPYGGTDRVLVRSENAGLDLVGLAANFHPYDEPDFYRRTPLSSIESLIRKKPPTNIISSEPWEDVHSEIDSRRSRYRFVWRGHTTPRAIDHARDVFNRLTPELKHAISDESIESLEWIIAPLIFTCHESNEDRQRKIRLNRWIMAVYLGTVFFAVLVAGVIMPAISKLR